MDSSSDEEVAEEAVETPAVRYVEGYHPRHRPLMRGDGRHQETGRNFQIPRTLNFDGKSRWAAFYLKFQTYAAREQWSLAEQKDQLCFCLKDKASEFYAICIERNPTISFEDLVRKFRKRYDRQDLPESAQVKFYSMQQELTDSLEDWSEKLLATANVAFDNLPEKYVETQVILRFCLGCNDPEAGEYAANGDFTHIEQAIDAVRKYQHNHRAIHQKHPKSIRQISSDSEDERAASRILRALTRSQTVEAREENNITKRMDKVEEGLEEMKKRFDKVEGMLTRLTEVRRSRSPSPGQGNCFRCGEPGHMIASCPRPRSPSPLRDKRVTFRGGNGGDKAALNWAGTGSKS
jgi:hypothetical protein